MADERLNPVKSITVARRLQQLGCGNLDERQLQKLAYYAHGWSLALLSAPLTTDAIQARDLGSVYPDIRNRLEDDMNAVLEAHRGSLSRIQRKLVKKVYDGYGHYSGIELSLSTHEKHRLNPWRIVWHDLGARRGLIEDSLINHYFRIRLAPLYKFTVAPMGDKHDNG